MANTPYTIDNPVGVNDLGQLLERVINALFDLAIPVAVALYVWAGILYLTAGTTPARTEKAKTILKTTTIGLIIIFVGGGFVDLIRSIINGN